MYPMRRYIIMRRFLILVTLSAGLGVAIAMYVAAPEFWVNLIHGPPPPEPQPTKANFDKIQLGMSEADVEKIVGWPIPQIGRSQVGWAGTPRKYNSAEGPSFTIFFGMKTKTVCAKIWHSDPPVEFHEPGWRENN